MLTLLSNLTKINTLILCEKRYYALLQPFSALCV